MAAGFKDSELLAMTPAHDQNNNQSVLGLSIEERFILSIRVGKQLERGVCG